MPDFKVTKVQHLPQDERPKGYDKADPRLHPCMVPPHAGNDWWTYPIHPAPQISNHLAELITGDHDLTLMDANNTEARHGGPFYDHAHYLASLACAIDAMNGLGNIEHSGDWDWYLGMVLRDGTKIGDGSFLDFEDDPDYDKETAHGYCDTFHVPTFSQTRPDNLSYADWFTTMPVILDLWHNSANPDGNSPITVQVKDIALVHFHQR